MPEVDFNVPLTLAPLEYEAVLACDPDPEPDETLTATAAVGSKHKATVDEQIREILPRMSPPSAQGKP